MEVVTKPRAISQVLAERATENCVNAVLADVEAEVKEREKP